MSPCALRQGRRSGKRWQLSSLPSSTWSVLVRSLRSSRLPSPGDCAALLGPLPPPPKNGGGTAQRPRFERLQHRDSTDTNLRRDPELRARMEARQNGSAPDSSPSTSPGTGGVVVLGSASANWTVGSDGQLGRRASARTTCGSEGRLWSDRSAQLCPAREKDPSSWLSIYLTTSGLPDRAHRPKRTGPPRRPHLTSPGLLMEGGPGR
jgi:hypothetical protein